MASKSERFIQNDSEGNQKAPPAENHRELLAYQCGIELLSRREHSRQELQAKLKLRHFLPEEIAIALAKLEVKGWQDDERFAEGYIRQRIHAGFGQQRIVAELKQRGIQISEASLLQMKDVDWSQILAQVWEKKFKGKIAGDKKFYAQQVRFLLHRGFDLESISQFLQGFPFQKKRD